MQQALVDVDAEAVAEGVGDHSGQVERGVAQAFVAELDNPTELSRHSHVLLVVQGQGGEVLQLAAPGRPGRVDSREDEAAVTDLAAGQAGGEG